MSNGVCVLLVIDTDTSQLWLRNTRCGDVEKETLSKYEDLDYEQKANDSLVGRDNHFHSYWTFPAIALGLWVLAHKPGNSIS